MPERNSLLSGSRPRFKFPGCLLLAAHVLRTLHPFSVPQTVSGEIRKDIHKGNRFSPLCPQFLWTDGAKWFAFCGYLLFLPGLLLRYRIGYADYMIIPGSFLPMIATLKSSSSFSTGISSRTLHLWFRQNTLPHLWSARSALRRLPVLLLLFPQRH